MRGEERYRDERYKEERFREMRGGEERYREDPRLRESRYRPENFRADPRFSEERFKERFNASLSEREGGELEEKLTGEREHLGEKILEENSSFEKIKDEKLKENSNKEEKILEKGELVLEEKTLGNGEDKLEDEKTKTNYRVEEKYSDLSYSFPEERYSNRDLRFRDSYNNRIPSSLLNGEEERYRGTPGTVSGEEERYGNREMRFRGEREERLRGDLYRGERYRGEEERYRGGASGEERYREERYRGGEDRYRGGEERYRGGEERYGGGMYSRDYPFNSFREAGVFRNERYREGGYRGGEVSDPRLEGSFREDRSIPKQRGENRFLQRERYFEERNFGREDPRLIHAYDEKETPLMRKKEDGMTDSSYYFEMKNGNNNLGLNPPLPKSEMGGSPFQENNTSLFDPNKLETTNPPFN